MKVLFLSNSIGGLIHFRLDLMKTLCKRGDKVVILSPLEQDISLKPIHDLGCDFIQIEMEQRGKNPLNDLKLLNTYKRYLREIRPDIVLAYTVKPNIYGSVACRHLGIPIIASVTGLGMAIVGRSFLQKIMIALFKWGFKNTDYVFFQNDNCKKFFEDHNIKAKESAIVAGSGVNIQHFAFEDYPSEENGINFLYIGKILTDKGSHHLFDAIEYCHEKHPHVHFHIVGPKDSPALSEKVDELSEKKWAEFYGKQEDVRPFIRKAHCIVHPSYHEGMSNALLEGASIGRPAVATNISGCKEIIDEGVTGFLCEPKSTNALIESIEEFIALPYEARKQMGIKAREKVEREFDRNKVVQVYLNQIDRLAKKS